jgi:hypothetical protein
VAVQSILRSQQSGSVDVVAGHACTPQGRTGDSSAGLLLLPCSAGQADRAGRDEATEGCATLRYETRRR